MGTKLLLIILDGVPYNDWLRLFGNLEGWVSTGEARRWRMRSVLPSVSACCYASIHTGLPPQQHGVTSNETIFRLEAPDIFSETRKAGLVTGAVTHSFWSEFFNRAPFDDVRDIEYDEPESCSINHGRFHTMTGYSRINQMTPSDADLFATLSNLCTRFDLDYGILHSCTLDGMGHRFGHDCIEMDKACTMADAMLAPFIRRWRNAGYEVIVTADHGQSARGHHGGAGADQQDFALYYFGEAEGMPGAGEGVLDQLALAPSILNRLGVVIPQSMSVQPFLPQTSAFHS